MISFFMHITFENIGSKKKKNAGIRTLHYPPAQSSSLYKNDRETDSFDWDPRCKIKQLLVKLNQL